MHSPPIRAEKSHNTGWPPHTPLHPIPPTFSWCQTTLSRRISLPFSHLIGLAKNNGSHLIASNIMSILCVCVCVFSEFLMNKWKHFVSIHPGYLLLHILPLSAVNMKFKVLPIRHTKWYKENVWRETFYFDTVSQSFRPECSKCITTQPKVWAKCNIFWPQKRIPHHTMILYICFRQIL